MRTIFALTITTGFALTVGALMQVYYSGLSPADPWSAPAVYSFLAVMFLNLARLFF